LAFWLLADTEFADYVAVAIGIVRLQVIQKAAALADQLQKTTPGSVILLVRLEVLGQFAIRALRIAIWTSGEPVSVSWVRKLSIRVVFLAVASTACVTPLVFSGPLFSV
jgi:hypothetical protein